MTRASFAAVGYVTVAAAAIAVPAVISDGWWGLLILPLTALIALVLLGESADHICPNQPKENQP